MGNRRRSDRGQLEQRLLILVTLGLVAFGLVMVFSATSASAALGDGDPMRFLVKQGLYAVAGLVLLAALTRVDYHGLRSARAAAPRSSPSSAASRCSRSRPPINGAHRWFVLGPVSVQPSEIAKLAILPLGVRRRSHGAARRRTLGELMKPVGLVVVAVRRR